MCAAGGGDFDVFFSEGVEDGGDVVVEGVCFVRAIADGDRWAGGVGDGFYRWVDVGVDPEGPEGVVEVEDYEFWEGKTVAEGGADVGR